jgi:dUTP pyrophosphatase
MGNIFGVQKFGSTENVKFPVRKTPFSAGYDLFSINKIVIPAGQSKLVPTGLSFLIPEHHFLFITNCSSNSLKGLVVGAGVIDSDYTGQIFVQLFNFSSTDCILETNSKVAQAICIPIFEKGLTRLDPYNSFPLVTERQNSGFGVPNTNVLNPPEHFMNSTTQSSTPNQ